MPHNCLSKTVQQYMLLSYFGIGPFPLLMFLCRVSFYLKQISFTFHLLYICSTWLQKPAHDSVEVFSSNISAVAQLPILPRVRLAWLKSEVFLVLSYTHISISSLGWLSLSGSWSLPALQVPSVTRTTPTYWARLHSPVNYQTGVSFCPSPANPFSAPLSYWAVVCPET